MVGKRVQFDAETWHSVDLLSKDRMATFQELADEAFRDLLRKHGRPSSLKEALRRSAGQTATVVPLDERRAARQPAPDAKSQPATRKARAAKKKAPANKK